MAKRLPDEGWGPLYTRLSSSSLPGLEQRSEFVMKGCPHCGGDIDLAAEGGAICIACGRVPARWRVAG